MPPNIIICLEKDCCPVIEADDEGKHIIVGERLLVDEKEIVLWPN